MVWPCLLLASKFTGGTKLAFRRLFGEHRNKRQHLGGLND